MRVSSCHTLRELAQDALMEDEMQARLLAQNDIREIGS